MENELFGFSLIKIKKGKYRVTGNNCPGDMIITIKEFSNGYIAESNYNLSNRENDDIGYQATRLLPTQEETIRDLLMSLKPIENSKWIKCN